MTVRENVHQLVDTLPEDRLPDVLELLSEFEEDDDTLSPEEQAALERGLEDIRQGRTVSWEEYKRTRGL
jgi:PHD/YefM family antitoxin component YafN of YafNO toxin-antitoxin module